MLVSMGLTMTMAGVMVLVGLDIPGRRHVLRGAVAVKGEMGMAVTVQAAVMAVQVFVDQIGANQHLFIGEDIGRAAGLFDPVVFREQRHGHLHVGHQ